MLEKGLQKFYRFITSELIISTAKIPEKYIVCYTTVSHGWSNNPHYQIYCLAMFLKQKGS